MPLSGTPQIHPLLKSYMSPSNILHDPLFLSILSLTSLSQPEGPTELSAVTEMLRIATANRGCLHVAAEHLLQLVQLKK